jgi:hypothetical protein
MQSPAPAPDYGPSQPHRRTARCLYDRSSRHEPYVASRGPWQLSGVRPATITYSICATMHRESRGNVRPVSPTEDGSVGWAAGSWARSRPVVGVGSRLVEGGAELRGVQDSSRRPASARPSTRSLCLAPYASTVLISVTPRSRAWRTAAIDSSSSTSPHPASRPPALTGHPWPTPPTRSRSLDTTAPPASS